MCPQHSRKNLTHLHGQYLIEQHIQRYPTAKDQAGLREAQSQYHCLCLIKYMFSRLVCVESRTKQS